ncbi:hypothetical protein P171DRAFT_480182 [Karstenula rhodostoma CBS 690.94]|uniref:Uncharacterized protein n=1 Tax=Karstenula rhodostoma CBS 690.94 TaxID=1392251 RepID=A0A9P4UJB0_9PLEO|nr:hypothetical protein P171DRAFT_480182 [Karstenula rhodostoma CBS 690.94]
MKLNSIIATFAQAILVSASQSSKDPKPPRTPTYTPYTYTTSLCTPTATQPYTFTNTCTGLATTSILVS